MNGTLRLKAKRWLVAAGLIVLTGIISLAFVLQAGGQVQAATLTTSEQYWLTYMREEEKLARDVYLYLHDEWQSRIFSNIAASEQVHMNAIKTLLDRYGIVDPAAGKGIGEFDNPKFRDLYVQLTEQGSASLVEALRVGVFIEETDIDDLNEAITLTVRKDIKRVYGSILQGSFNHLDAFESKLAKM
jgi:hypothetical protein